jgi:hypothetical protein
VTLLGAFFIPITIVCFLWRPQQLLSLLILASVFEGGSVLVGGIGQFTFGLSPFYFVELFVALRLILWVWNRGAWLPTRKTPEREIVVLLLVFLAWSFASGLVMPRLFAGIPVYAPREMEDMDMVLGNLVPLRWTLSNFAQGIYLTLNVAAVVFAFHAIQTKDQSEKLASALRWAVSVVVTVGLLQHVALLAGWSFPYALFNNNPNNPFDAQIFDQAIGDFLRIISTFAGPVYAGSFLAAIASGLLASYLRGRRGARYLLALLAVLLVLLDTTSTTGYLALAIMLCPLLICFNPFAKRESSVQSSLVMGWTTVTLTALCIGGLALLLIPSLSQAVVAMTVEKSDGISFISRVAADQDAVTIFENTHGLGAGLGSSRHSSLLMTLLCTVGIIGTTLFAVVIYKIVKFFPGRRAPSMLQMSFWSLIGLLVAQSIAVPDINRPVLWALIIAVVAQSNVYRNRGDNSDRHQSTNLPAQSAT